MKIGLLSDSHYCVSLFGGAKYRPGMLAKTKVTLDKMKEEGVELIVFLGDLIDKCRTQKQEIKCIDSIADLYRETGVPYVILRGNHDCLVFPPEEFFYRVGGREAPFSLSFGDKLLLFIDGNYSQSGVPYAAGTNNWTDTAIPEKQVVWLRETLSSATEKDIFVFSHQNFVNDNKKYNVKNASLLCDMFEKDGRVRAVFQGHYHAGGTKEINGIRYVVVPSLTKKGTPYLITTL